MALTPPAPFSTMKYWDVATKSIIAAQSQYEAEKVLEFIVAGIEHTANTAESETSRVAEEFPFPNITTE